MLGMALVQKGNVEQGIDHYRRGLQCDPGNIAARHNLAVVLAGLGRVDEAIAQYRMVLQVNPDYVLTLNNLALLRATHPDPKFRDGGEAVILARRAVGLTPGDPDYLGTLAAAYAEAGRFAEAVQTVQGRGARRATRQPGPGRIYPGQASAL